MKLLHACCCLLILSLVSCYPKAILTEPIAPAVVKARADVAASNASSARLENRVKSIHESTAALGAGIATAAAEADRLRRRGTASALELEAQWLALTKIQTESLMLQSHTAAAKDNAAEQRLLGRAAEVGMVELVSTAKRTDQATEDLKTQVVKQADNAALGRAVKGFVWLAVAGALVGCVLLVIPRLR